MTLLDENSLIKELIMTASRLEAFANKYFFEPFGLTLSSAKVLCLLHLKGALSHTHILKAVGGTKSNISQRLRLLEKSGLIEAVVTTEKDKRIQTVQLSELGHAKLHDVHEILHKNTLELEKIFNEQEKNTFKNILSKINNALDECQRPD